MSDETAGTLLVIAALAVLAFACVVLGHIMFESNAVAEVNRTCIRAGYDYGTIELFTGINKCTKTVLLSDIEQ